MAEIFPNVPIAIGVPAVLRSVLQPADRAATRVIQQSSQQTNAETATEWGLFTQDGELAAPADNVVAVEVTLEARISDYPVAPNTAGRDANPVGFGSYNKVKVPFDIRLIMTRGGSVKDRQDFLRAVHGAWGSTTLYNVVTPECVYLDVNVVGVRRMAASDRGMGLMTLEIQLRKVNQTAKLLFTTAKEPTGAETLQNGSVQTQSPPPPVAQADPR